MLPAMKAGSGSRRRSPGGLPRPGRLRNLVAHQGDFAVTQALLIEPVRARDFLERVDCRLNAFGPRHRDELDVAVNVADGKDALPTGLEIGVDGNAAILVEPHRQPFKGLLRPQESDLDDDQGAVE